MARYAGLEGLEVTKGEDRCRSVFLRGSGVAAILILLMLGGILAPPAQADDSDEWGTPALIDKDEGYIPDGYRPDLAVDGDGNVFAVWKDVTGAFDLFGDGYLDTVYTIWAKRYEAGRGWLVTEAIGRALYASDPRIALLPTGTAIVVWSGLNESGLGDVWASSFNPASGWSGGSPVWGDDGTRPHYIGGPRIVADPANEFAVVVWEAALEPSYALWGVFAGRFVPGQGWSEPALLTGPRPDWSDRWGDPVAINAQGHVIAAWVEEGGILGTTRYFPGVGWNGYYRLDTGGRVVGLSVLASLTTWVVVWEDWNETTDNVTVRSSSFAPELGWEEPVEIARNSVNPRLSIDETGNAVVVLCDYLQSSIVIHQLRPSGGWTMVDRFPIGMWEGVPSLTCHPQIAFDSSGNGVVVWEDWTSSGRAVWATRKGPGVSWGSRAIIVGPHSPPEAGRDFPPPRMSMGPSGVAAIAWQQIERTYDEVLQAFGSEVDTWVAVSSSPADLTPPALVLAKPSPDFTTTKPTITVSGFTEPSATLDVNGVWAAVASDGSFSIVISLTEGRNTITAVATDPAGNTAVASVDVTFVNPLDAVSQKLLDTEIALADALRDLGILGTRTVLIAIALVSVATVSAILFALSRKGGGLGPGKRTDLTGWAPIHSFVPERTEDSAAFGPKDMATGSNSKSGTKKVWPRRAQSGKLVRLTSKERIILHLLQFARYGDAPEVPPELTQGRIAEAAGIDRRHFTQYARPLVRDGLVRERLVRVRGALQRRRVYVLTEDGKQTALEVRDRIRSALVRVKNGAEEREVTIAEVLLETRGSKSILDILRESIETGVVDLKS